MKSTRTPFFSWLVAALALVSVGVIGAPMATAETVPSCQFVLGFASIRDLLGATLVGDCIENQQANPENGDAFQRTTGGMLLWRKADNWTAFTDGYFSWINGPVGIQQRLNSERFSWEADLRIAPTSTPIPPPPTPEAEEVTPLAPLMVIAGQTITQVKDSVWVTGELRNAGAGIAYGYTVKALFVDQWGNAVASGQYNMTAQLPRESGAPVPPGGIVPFKLAVKVVNPYDRVEVTVGPNPGAIGPGSAGTARTIPLTDLRLSLENKSGVYTAHGIGTLSNDTQRLFRDVKVEVWFLDASGQVVDVVQKPGGVEDVLLKTYVIRPGQSTPFDIVSAASSTNAAVAGIKSVKAFAFAQEADLP